VFLRPLIAEIAGEDVTIVDTGAAVARQLAHVLDERDLIAPQDAKASERFWTSGDLVESERVMSALLGRKVSVQKLTV
jgi:glutamate racemase